MAKSLLQKKVCLLLVLLLVMSVPGLGFAAPAQFQADSLLPPSPQAVQQIKAEARDALRRTMQTLDLQSEAPERVEKMLSAGQLTDKLPSPFPSQNVATVMLWAAILALIIVILVHCKGNLWSFSRARRLERQEAEAVPVAVAARMDKARATADVLAFEGSYAEAMHMLLLQSVSELRRRLDTPIAASLTSREIAHRLALPPGPRQSFAHIISQVEISYFGAHQPDREDYLACRQHFEALTAALGQPAQALPASGEGRP